MGVGGYMGVCMMQDYWGLGACSRRKFDALRLLLRPFFGTEAGLHRGGPRG